MERTDVVVVGGTPSGVACAVRCAREGLKVVLVSFMSHLGGSMSSGLGVTDNVYDGFRSPIYDSFVHKVRDYYRRAYGERSKQYEQCYSKGKLHFEPHVAERIFQELIGAESRITIMYRYYPISAERSGTIISAITVKSFENGDTVRLEADAFADASYEGDLAAVAGAELRTGREGRKEFHEPHAGKIFVFPRQGPVAPEAVTDLIEVTTAADNGQRIFADSTGEGDEAFQSYNFRVCLTCDPDNLIYPDRPDSYDRSLYLGLVEKPEDNRGTTFVLRSQLMLSDGGWSLRSHIPNDKLTWNDPLLIGAQLAYPTADWASREEIVRKHADFALGMLYFLQHDDAVSPEVRREALRWGLPKDEFVDNGHFPYEILVREGRRLAGRFIFTEHDALLANGLNRTPIHADSVGIADWPISSHDCTADRRSGSLNDGVLNLAPISHISQIPYRALLPKDLDNLLVTICLSCTHIGWGALRLEPVFIQMGESAAFAIALARELRMSPGTLNPESLTRKLADRQVLVSHFQDMDKASGEDWLPAIQYFGTKGFFDSYLARPEEPLNLHTARIWVQAFGGLIDGRIDPPETARKLSQETGETEPVGGNAFRQLLMDELAARRLAIPPSALSSIRPCDTISRGEACSSLYRIASTLSV